MTINCESKSKKNRKFLLLQARIATDPMTAHELQCFAERAGYPEDCFICKNLALETPELSWLDAVDAVFVGGAGNFSVAYNPPSFLESTCALLREVVKRDIPTLAACFGFHLFSVALGGEVKTFCENTEVGSYLCQGFETAKKDPLFNYLPDTYMTQQGHHDFLIRPPEDVIILARSELADYQAYRIRGKQIWATQFHPEMSCQANRERYLSYLGNYGDPETADADIISRFAESPEADQMISRFLGLYFK